MGDNPRAEEGTERFSQKKYLKNSGLGDEWEDSWAEFHRELRMGSGQ